MGEPFEYFRKVNNFLVIEEPFIEHWSKAVTIDVGRSISNMPTVRRRVSLKRWEYIKTWHILEPNSVQFYCCLDLYAPHYQVHITGASDYVQALITFTKRKGHANAIQVYLKSTPLYRNNYLCVANDMAVTTTLTTLSEYFDFNTVTCLIEHYKEQNSSDAGRGNIFFDRGIASSQCQQRQKEWYGLSVPSTRSVDKKMSSEEKLFCNKLEKLLYLTMKDLLPSSISELKEQLFLVPSISKNLLRDGVPGCHQV